MRGSFNAPAEFPLSIGISFTFLCKCIEIGALNEAPNSTYVREMSQRDFEARRAAVAILKRGLMTVPEVAAHAGVSRQLVRYWCKRANVNFAKVRSAKIAKLWSREIS